MAVRSMQLGLPLRQAGSFIICLRLKVSIKYCRLFERIFIDVLSTHAPVVTTKTVLANNHQFITKALRKVIMTSSRLKSAYLKTRNSENWKNYKKQRNFCTNLFKKTRSEYFHIFNSKRSWKKIKLFFLEKGLETNNIILREKRN